MHVTEVELPSGSLVIADLHLSPGGSLPGDGAPQERFVTWLASVAGVPRIVILGDLFDYWVGPAQARWPGPRLVLDALTDAVAAGTAIDVIPGNRDFLLDRAFEARTGCRVRQAGLIGIAKGGARLLFVHGDELATLDRSYQRLRRVLRSRPLRLVARSLPGWASAWVARRLRRASQSAVAAKPAPHMALQPAACRALAAETRAGVVVCGHAHRYRDEELEDGPRWLVLDAYGGERDVLELAGGDRIVTRSSRADRNG